MDGRRGRGAMSGREQTVKYDAVIHFDLLSLKLSFESKKNQSKVASSPHYINKFHGPAIISSALSPSDKI